MNANLSIEHDALPLDLGPLKVDEQGQLDVGCSQVVDALRQVLVGKLVHAL